MNAFALHAEIDDADVRRWSASAMTMVLAHALVVVLALIWLRHAPPPGAPLPVIMVDMAPATASPDMTPLDLAPGPQMQQTDAPPPLPAAPQEQIEEIVPTPPQPAPAVAAPPEQTVQAKPSPQPPAKADPTPVRPKPKATRAESKSRSDARPAPRTSASPRAERQAPAASAASSGASAQAVASYNRVIAAHLQRFKQYPAAAKAAGQQGIARLSFSLGRGGQVLASRLGGSSGHPALDAETLAMVRRAQPFPAFPPDIKQASMSFSVPVAFSIR